MYGGNLEYTVSFKPHRNGNSRRFGGRSGVVITDKPNVQITGSNGVVLSHYSSKPVRPDISLSFQIIMREVSVLSFMIP